MQLRACVIKETRLLVRDTHALFLLFIMPLTFILIMSLAMQDAFEARAGSKQSVLIGSADVGDDVRQFVDRLTSSEAYEVRLEGDVAAKRLTDMVRAGDATLAIAINPEFGRFLNTGAGEPVTVIVAPNADKRDQIIFMNAVRTSLISQRMATMLGEIGLRPDSFIVPAISVVHAYGEDAAKQPTAVQQNVPAWLVFAIFFVSIPFSTAFIRERQLGTHQRLRTIAISPIVQIIGKLVPYFVVNQVQVVAMLLAGMFLVPLLGGNALELNGGTAALILLCVCLSCAALGLALLVGVVARTIEQATMLSGLGNIVLAAIGGIMVPKFIMPTGMQQAAQLSPMAWGLDGFLQLFLYDGGIIDIMPQLLQLGLLATCATLIAAVVFRYSE